MHYRGFEIKETQHRRKSAWTVVNSYQRVVGTFQGAGSFKKSKEWIDSLYAEGKDWEFMNRAFGQPTLREDEPHPDRVGHQTKFPVRHRGW